MTITKNFIKRLKKAEKLAFEELFDNYSGILKSLAFRYLNSWDEAEDIIQETFVVIYQKVKQYSGKGSFEGWMKRITVNNCLKYLKTNKKLFFEELKDYSIIENTENEIIDEKNIELLVKKTDFSEKEILNVVSNLPSGFRIVFNMYVLENFKHKDIAKKLNISESTSKTQLLRARKILQNNLYILAKKKLFNEKDVFLKEVIGKRNQSNG